MDSMIYNKMLHTPIYTGTPGEPPKSRPREKTNDNAFKELLEQRLKEESQVSFSKHAMERVVERGVDVSSEKLDRLNGRPHGGGKGTEGAADSVGNHCLCRKCKK